MSKPKLKLRVEYIWGLTGAHMTTIGLFIGSSKYAYSVDPAVAHRFRELARFTPGRALSYLKSHAESVQKLNPSSKG